MTRYAVSNDEGTVTIHVWAFDKEDALYRVEQLTDSKEFRKVKDADSMCASSANGLV